MRLLRSVTNISQRKQNTNSRGHKSLQSSRRYTNALTVLPRQTAPCSSSFFRVHQATCYPQNTKMREQRLGTVSSARAHRTAPLLHQHREVPSHGIYTQRCRPSWRPGRHRIHVRIPGSSSSPPPPMPYRRFHNIAGTGTVASALKALHF